jgi:hypothetical protein
MLRYASIEGLINKTSSLFSHVYDNFTLPHIWALITEWLCRFLRGLVSFHRVLIQAQSVPF